MKPILQLSGREVDTVIQSQFAQLQLYLAEKVVHSRIVCKAIAEAEG